MRVLVAGCGDLGTEAGLRLAAAGHDVLGLRRSIEVLPDAITGVRGDLGGVLPDLPGDVEVVLYTAAAGERTKEAYRRAYRDGPQRVLDALERAGAPVRRIVFVSSTAVYGVSDGAQVDEATATVPATPTGAVLVEAERALHQRRPDALALRLAGIYGPGRTMLIDQVRSGRATIPATPSFTNRIHRDDAARALLHLATRDEPPPPVLVGVDHDPAPRGEVLRFLADELGMAHPLVEAPVEPADDGAGDGAPPTGKRCRNDALVATGFSFTYPSFREGYRAVLAGEGTRHV